MKKKRVLITGCHGFVATYLAKYLEELGVYTVYGFARHKKTEIKHLRYDVCDLTNEKKLNAIIKKVKPDYIFHLAALSSVALSWKMPNQFLNVNLWGSVLLFEAVRKYSPHSRVLAISSSEEYGAVEYAKPIRETQIPNPRTPYGVSKLAMTHFALSYVRRYGLDIVVSRAFSHTGAGQPENFVVSQFAKNIAEIEAGIQKPLMRVGNLKTSRDFLDVRDVVRAYELLARKGRAGEIYNVSSCRGLKIDTILQFYLKQCRLKIKVATDPQKIRPNEVMSIVGDHQKLTAETGWKPRVRIEKTLADVLNYWRERYHDRKTIKK